MDTEEEFENASYGSSEGDTISGSESESEGTESSSDSEESKSPSKAAQETRVPLTAYEAARLKRIKRNKKKIEELGLHILASAVGVPKAEKVKQPENKGAGRLGASQQGVEVSRITRSRGAPSPTDLLDQPPIQVRFPLPLYLIPVHFPHPW